MQQNVFLRRRQQQQKCSVRCEEVLQVLCNYFFASFSHGTIMDWKCLWCLVSSRKRRESQYLMVNSHTTTGEADKNMTTSRMSRQVLEEMSKHMSNSWIFRAHNDWVCRRNSAATAKSYTDVLNSSRILHRCGASAFEHSPKLALILCICDLECELYRR